MKVLIIRLSAIGDTIHTLPVAAAIKSRMPEAHIGWVVEPLSAPLLVNNPCVDEVFVLPRKEWMHKLASPANWPAVLSEMRNFWAGVRQKKFDVVLELQGLMKSAVCAVASGAPRRIGFSYTREGSGLLLTEKVEVGDYFAPDRHIVDVNLEVARYFLRSIGLSEDIKPAEIQFPLPVARVESDKIIAGADHAVLIPGTTWPSKIWPTDKWIELGKFLTNKLGLSVVIVGGAKEKETNGQIAEAIQSNLSSGSVTDISGQTSLLDLIALFKKSKLVVGADTGPLHLAAAVDKPKVVGVYGATPWRRVGPFGQNAKSVSLNLTCQPCFAEHCPLKTNACLKDLPAEQVFQEIQGLLR